MSAAARFPTRVRLGLAAVGLGGALAPLDTAVNAALPAIAAAFALEVRALQWLVICYVLTYVGLMPVCGRLGDLFGWRRVFRAGLLASVAGYLACAAAPDWPILLACRVFQGVGAALALSCAPALATSLVDESERPRALAAFAAMSALGAAAGPLIGGALAEAAGWPAVFWYRAPLALLALVALRFVPPDEARPAGRPFDAAGAALLAGGLGALVLALGLLRREPVSAAAMAALAVALLVLWWRHASRIAEPILRPGLFKDPDFALLNLANAWVFAASFAVLLILPHWLARVGGLSAASAGAVLALSPAGGLLGAALAGRLAQTVSARRIAASGLALAAAGLPAIGWLAGAAPLWALGALLVAQGVGLGLYQVAYTDVVTATLARRDRGVAGSLALLTRSFGVAGAAALLSAGFDLAQHRALAAGASPDAAFVAAFRLAFAVPALGLLAFLVATLPRRGLWRG